ncbi:MAG: DegT/DnrJ/EryC1/StrS family aminotransferase [Magnetospirillum sp. WYHS-4]
MKVPFCDHRVIGEGERRALLRAVEKVLDHGRLCPSPEADELERKAAARLGREHAVMLRSGGEAIRLVLQALGIGRGTEVIVSPFLSAATLRAIRQAGAKPVFCPAGDDLGVDPAALPFLIGPRTRAIMPTHWGGRLGDMDAYLDLGLPVIEDGAKSFGAERRGHKAGGSGLAGCFDLGPGGMLAGLGEAGLVVTDDTGLAERLRTGRGEAPPDPLQAALLVQRLKRVDGILLCREENARYYDEHLKGLAGLPEAESGERQAFDGYALRTGRRDRLRTYLERRGIATRLPEAAARGKAGRAGDAVIAIPVGERLGKPQRIYVAETIRRFFRVKGL